MEINFLYFLIWFLVVVVLLWFIPNDKIVVIGDFFKKVLPSIPFTSMVRIFKKDKEVEK